MMKLAWIYLAAFLISALFFGILMSIWGTSVEDRFKIGLKTGLLFGLSFCAVFAMIHFIIFIWRR